MMYKSHVCKYVFDCVIICPYFSCEECNKRNRLSYKFWIFLQFSLQKRCFSTNTKLITKLIFMNRNIRNEINTFAFQYISPSLVIIRT